MTMKVLVIGGGGREHALAWKIARDPRAPKVYAAPGSAGLESVAERVAIDPLDLEGLAAFALREGIDLTIVGPEAPLAAGKGVVICANEAEADEAIDGMLEGGSFGEAGSRVVVEEFLVGEEASFMAITDGVTSLPLASSQDHKAVFDGDRGPNTGGMGAYSPAPCVTPEVHAEIMKSVIEPTVRTLVARGIDYRGVLYAGIMLTAKGPKVLEYNVRFGDPECQALLMRLRSSILDLFDAAIDRRLADLHLEWEEGTSVCVVMAAEGYPGEIRKGDVIEGLDDANALPGVQVFHAGTTRDAEGRWLTAGGRVLGVCAVGARVADATAQAYAGVDRIHWKGAHCRRDIAWRALDREQKEGTVPVS
jgi:phosphoribosylamine--glycine ligase